MTCNSQCKSVIHVGQFNQSNKCVYVCVCACAKQGVRMCVCQYLPARKMICEPRSRHLHIDKISLPTNFQLNLQFL